VSDVTAPQSQPQTPSPPKIVVFKTRVYLTKNDERFRLNPMPRELVRLARDLEGKEVWAVLYVLDREIEIELPWLVVKRLKQIVFSESRDEKDIRDALGFLAFDVVNTYLRLILPSVPTVLYRDPEHIEMKKIQVGEISGIRILASGFTIWPSPEGEKTTNAFVIEAELYDVPDAEDYENYSQITVRIDLRKLINDVGIRWDISRM